MRPALFAALLSCIAAPSLDAQQPPQWHLEPVPRLLIGNDGQPGADFAGIVAAFKLADGRVVVADNGSSQLRVFRADGSFDRAVGRRGSGPGEFQFLRWVVRSGDTLFALDPMLRRATTILLSLEPRVLSSVTISAQAGRPFDVVGRLASGEWIAEYKERIDWNAAPGVQRERAGIGVVAQNGEGMARWIAEIPSTASFVNRPTGSLQDAGIGPIAFSPWHHAVGSANLLWFGESATPELTRWDPSANRRRNVALPLVKAAPTPELIARRRAQEDADDPRSRGSRFQAAKYSAEFLPKSLPFFEALLPAPQGGVWVQEYTGLRHSATRYWVLDREGRILATVSGPAGFRVTEVGDLWVVGVHRDEDDVESVRVYTLRRD